ncbi:ribonuclease H2 subunit B-like [Chenopodium quinoa]|uniref:ribonuclease H2 subunit B-like n=1 Tax=Chenopodium quinoa TaxID=63459 RepID=UPI000B77D16A|nr:ribonuclease H2 subunit B-like [Chenopodium quinoa]
MNWWESSDGEIRVLIAPDKGTSGTDAGQLLSLRHPKSGIATNYLYINEGLHEFQWFKKSYASWFLGEYVCEDGSLYISTPIDPVFIMLPIFEDARMKKGIDPGKFRQLDEILYIDGYPGYHHLLPVIEESMGVVCEVKDVGSTKFFRLDDSKVIAWLCEKVDRLKQTLLTLDKNYTAQDDKHTLAEVVSILGDYLRDKPWVELLCNHLRLNLQDLTRKADDHSSSTTDNVLQSSAQDNGGAESTNKKTAKTARQGKKVKIETDSHNIKDMFTRATRSRTKTT